MRAGAAVHRIRNDDGIRSHQSCDSRDHATAVGTGRRAAGVSEVPGGGDGEARVLRNQLKQSMRVRMSGAHHSAAAAPSMQPCLLCRGSGQVFHAYVFRNLPPPSQRATVGAIATPKENSKRHRSTIPCIPASDRCSSRRGTEAILAEELSVARRSLGRLELTGRPLRHTVSNPIGSSPQRRDKSIAARIFKE